MSNDRTGSGKEKTGFARVIVDDFKRGGHKRTIRRDLRDLYAFYLDEDERKRLADMGRLKRWFLMVWWLAKNLFLNFSPTRRILLLVSVWLAIQGDIQFTAGETDFEFGIRNWGFILLLFILMLELKDKLLARDELETGRKVQLSLLPKDQPEIAGWDIRFYTRPANDVGGDLVDYLKVSRGKLGLALGDVSGKGLGAALLMAKLQATLRAVATDFSSLADLGKRMNDIFIRDQVADKYSTLVYLEIGPGSGAVRMLNAGHLPPVIIRPQTIEETPPVAPPIGILADSTYEEQQLELAAGDMMIVYSDGVTEALNEAREFYGDDRLMKLLERTRGMPAAQVAKQLLDDVNRFVGEARLSDDLSLVILRRE